MAADKTESDVKPGSSPIELLTRIANGIEQQNRMIGALSQSITAELKKIAVDTETCKVYLGKLVKAGPVEVEVKSPGGGSSPQPSSPPMESTPIPGS